MDLVKIAEEAFACGKEHPEFRSGDTVTVSYRIKEGNKERIQQFRGDVIRISGHGNKKRFTVRKMSGNVGVERIFPIESPFIEEIVVNRRGKVRRAKLYYLRALFQHLHTGYPFPEGCKYYHSQDCAARLRALHGNQAEGQGR